MKTLKYILFGLGILFAISNIGGLFRGFGSPLLWIMMIAFFGIGASIKEKKD